MPLAKEFAAIRRLPRVAQAVLVCPADWARPLVAKLDAHEFFFSLAVNLLLDCCLPPAIDLCNTTDTATLTTLHPLSKIEFL